MNAVNPRTPDTDNLITAPDLHAALAAADDGTGPAVRLLDVRWRLDRPEGRPDYLRAHLPGAVYVDLEHELARRGQPEHGRHPLPAIDDFERSARGWGIDEGDLVVVYDDIRSVAAARLWWMLRRMGVPARVLDGGLRAWDAVRYPFESGDVRPAPGTIRLGAGRQAHPAPPAAVTVDEVADFAERGVLLDVRSPEHYRGEHSTPDPVGGHIPGAVNLPTLAHTRPDGTLLPAPLLRRTFEAAGVTAQTPVAVYCGSGIAAAHTVLALAQAGVAAHLYPGSWSQWSNTRGRPIAVGILPSGRVLV